MFSFRYMGDTMRTKIPEHESITSPNKFMKQMAGV